MCMKFTGEHPCRSSCPQKISFNRKKINSQTFFPVGWTFVVENVVDFGLDVVKAVETLKEIFAVVLVAAVVTTFIGVDIFKSVGVLQEV